MADAAHGKVLSLAGPLVVKALGWPLDAEKPRCQGREVIELVYTWETPVLERGK